MYTITVIIEPDADGTLHLPLPETWRHRPIRVKAELEPVEMPPDRPKAATGGPLEIFRRLQQAAALTPETAATWKDAVKEARQ